MTVRAIPVLMLLVLFVGSPILACEAMAREADASAQPMDMAGGCTDETTVQTLCAAPGMRMLVSVPAVSAFQAPISWTGPHGGEAEPVSLHIVRLAAPLASPSFPRAPVFLLHSAFLI